MDSCPDLAICDVRYSLTDPTAGRRAYALSHIPGAVHVDLHDDLAGSGAGRHPLPTTAHFAHVLERCGIGPDTEVVAYDDVGGVFAARLWWMLRAVGHESVSVLDGGFPAWTRSGRPVSDVIPSPTPTPHAVPHSWPATVDADGVDRALRDGRIVIDARSPERFRGEHEPLDPRAGHIPGAINVFQGRHLRPDGTHRPWDELAPRFALLDGSDHPIVYCGSGVSACHHLLVIDACGLAPFGDVLLYPGSWSDWSSDPSRPIETGP
jgi:thiosulfate/3-mercaptopyruvate sulfurtransferase